MIRLATELSEILRRGGTLVVPTRQRAHAARLAFAAAQLAQGRRVWDSPDILALEAWLTREIEQHAASSGVNLARLLSAAEDWLLWRQCTAEATGELDLVNRGALAESLRRASALAADSGIEILAGQDVSGTEPALLRNVQRAVAERSRALGAATVGSLVRSLPSAAHSALPVRLVGFLSVSARIREVAARRNALVAHASPETAGTRPRAIIAADEQTERELIALWCKTQLERSAEARLLVVLPGGSGSRERLATLIRQTMNPGGWLAFSPTLDPSSASPAILKSDPIESLVAIEGGNPLARIPAVTHALTALRWLGGEKGDFAALSEWLRAPYWKGPGPAARAGLDLWLRERGHLQFDLHELNRALGGATPSLESAAHELSGQISKASLALGQGSASPREWSQRFRAALDSFAWPGERTRSSDDQQTIARFHELLDEFGQLNRTARSMTRDAAIQWLIELSARTPFQPADDDAVVTISPMLADPVVRYDGIWVAGLHSEVLPQPVQPDPFLPLAAQLAAGIPAASAAGRLEEARRLLEAWSRATDELVLSVPARTEDLDLLPSPLLEPWLAKTSPAEIAAAASLWLPSRMRREGLLESLADEAGLAWPLERPLPAGTRSLDLQNTCPFRAYAELRLGSTELGIPEPGVAPDERGKLLHVALQKLWTRLGDSRFLSALSEPALGELIDATVAAAANALWGGEEEPRPLALVRECRRTSRLMGVLCKLERERPAFRVQDTELGVTLNVARAQVSMRIDRVDALESGGRAILDYKSGKRVTGDWYGERPSHPQLLAYLAALGEDVVAMATVNVTAREVRFDGIARASGLIPKVKGAVAPEGGDQGEAWVLRRREWLACLERLAVGFVTGRAAVDPKPGACDYCHLESLCRIADRGLPDLEPEEADWEDGHE